MFFRWLHEHVAFKPWRPAVECVLRLGSRVVDFCGKRVKAIWHAALHVPKPARLIPSQLKQIVVIRPDRIGDAVLSTPALRALRQAAPQARITVIASTAAAPFMRLLTSIDEVLVVPGDRLADWWRARRLLQPLRDAKPDCVIVLQSAWPAALLGWWLKGSHRVGFNAGGMGWLFTDAVPYPFLKRKEPQVLVNLYLLQAAGIPTPPADSVQLEAPITGKGRAEADVWLCKQGCDDKRLLVVIHPGSRSKYTQWAPEKFAIISDKLASDPNNQVVLLCGPHEEAIVERVMRTMRNSVFVAKDLPLETVIALLERSALFIGNATGTMHLASAVCRKVVAIIGGTHPQDCPERWGPWGKDHRIVHKTPEETIGRSTWDWVGPEGLGFIQPEDVLTAIR